MPGLSNAARVLVATSLMVLAATPVLLSQTNEATERFTFVAANASQAGPGGESRLELVVNRWSTDAERDAVFSVVAERGPEKVLDALREASAVGYMHWPGGLDYSLRYARRVPRPDGGEDVVLVADSQVWHWWNSAGPTRSTDYPFTVIQLQLTKQGTGEGKLSLATKIRGDKEAGIVLDNYSDQPSVLTEVRRERRDHQSATAG